MENLEEVKNVEFIEDVVPELSNTEKIEKIQSINSDQWVSMTRKQRRDYLKRNTNYFQSKRVLPLELRMQLIKKNIEFGNIRQKLVMEKIIKENETIFQSKEKVYRSLLNDLKYTEKEIEQKIDKWYSIVIKEKSFMTK